MLNHIKQLLLPILLLTVSVTFAQQERENDTIKTDVIDVVKPYTPSISDAFKVKETPNIDEQEELQKKEVKYNIFSFPVASTFKPAKGKPAPVDIEIPPQAFSNYASLGVGFYLNVLGELYVSHELNRDETVGGYLSHHSSQGGIQGRRLNEDGFSNTKFNLNYSRELRDLNWVISGGYQHQMYNWYGLPDVVSNGVANTIDPKHQYHNMHFGGDVNFTRSRISNVNAIFRRFSDDQGSAENRFTGEVTGIIPIRDNDIKTTLTLDYLGGTFDRQYNLDQELKYGNFNVGISPTYQLIRDDLKVNLGVSLYYLNDSNRGENKFYVYPNIDASYRLSGETVIAFGGLQGDLINNSYYSLVEGNTFLSPTLNIAPTNQLVDAFVGLKGKLSSNLAYKLRVGYKIENDKALFTNNVYKNVTASQNYDYGNSFNVVYDDVNTLQLSGEIKVDFNRNFTLGLNANYYGYSSDNQAEAWNLPDFKGSLFLDYQITEKWFAGASLFYVGERKDQFAVESSIVTLQPTIVTLDSYFDANVNVGYHLNDRISFYLKGNNLAGQDAPRWQNYPVQGLQFLGGMTYKFDF